MPEFIIKMRRVFRGQWQPSIRKLHIVIWNTSGICRSFLPTRWHGAVGTVDFGDGMRHWSLLCLHIPGRQNQPLFAKLGRMRGLLLGFAIRLLQICRQSAPHLYAWLRMLWIVILPKYVPCVLGHTTISLRFGVEHFPWTFLRVRKSLVLQILILIRGARLSTILSVRNWMSQLQILWKKMVLERLATAWTKLPIVWLRCACCWILRCLSNKTVIMSVPLFAKKFWMAIMVLTALPMTIAIFIR